MAMQAGLARADERQHRAVRRVDKKLAYLAPQYEALRQVRGRGVMTLGVSTP